MMSAAKKTMDMVVNERTNTGVAVVQTAMPLCPKTVPTWQAATTSKTTYNSPKEAQMISKETMT